MIGGVPIVVFLLVTCRFQFAESDFGQEIGRLLDELSGANKKNDILFLIDASASLSSREFESEKKFIRSFLSGITVALDATRVEVIPFADTASRYIDGISNPSLDKHKCDLFEKLKLMPHGSNGYGRDIRGALELAYQVSVGIYSANKRFPFSLEKTVVILITAGKWDADPVHVVKRLRIFNVKSYAIGIGSNSLQNILGNLVSDPYRNAFYFGSFEEFDKVLDFGRHTSSTRLQTVDSKKCNNKCSSIESCVCDREYGQYKCLCPRGQEWSEKLGKCKPCPYNQYNYGSSNYCKTCPANSGHGIIGSISVSDCRCFKGYAGSPEHGDSCTVRSCEKLAPPQNGAFVGTCNSVYESVCRIECNKGYELLGSEERKCIVRENELMDWSGIPSHCNAIRCPFLFVPNADPPICSSFSMSPGTYCSFRCRDGFYMKGSEVRVCQQDKSWTGSQTTCEQKAVF